MTRPRIEIPQQGKVSERNPGQKQLELSKAITSNERFKDYEIAQKEGGVNIGFKLTTNNPELCNLFVKQFQRTDTAGASALEEYFSYEILYQLGVGPKIFDVISDESKTPYLVTEDLGKSFGAEEKKFRTLEQKQIKKGTKPKSEPIGDVFKTYKKFTELTEQQKEKLFCSIILGDMACSFLNLGDIRDNGGNFGIVRSEIGEEKNYQLAINDFVVFNTLEKDSGKTLRHYLLGKNKNTNHDQLSPNFATDFNRLIYQDLQKNRQIYPLLKKAFETFLDKDFEQLVQAAKEKTDQVFFDEAGEVKFSEFSSFDKNIFGNKDPKKLQDIFHSYCKKVVGRFDALKKSFENYEAKNFAEKPAKKQKFLLETTETLSSSDSDSEKSESRFSSDDYPSSGSEPSTPIASSSESEESPSSSPKPAADRKLEETPSSKRKR